MKISKSSEKPFASIERIKVNNKEEFQKLANDVAKSLEKQRRFVEEDNRRRSSNLSRLTFTGS
jgi:hypothetical protein